MTARCALITAVATAFVLASTSRALAFDFYEHEFIGEVVCKVMLEVKQDKPDEARDACKHLLPYEIAVAGDHAGGPDEIEEKYDKKLAIRRDSQRAEVYAWLAQSRRAWDDLVRRDVKRLTSIVKAGTTFRQIKELQAALNRNEGNKSVMRLHVREEEPEKDEPEEKCERAAISATPRSECASPDSEYPGEIRKFFDGLADRRPACFSPSKELLDGFSGLPGYASLARSNYSHFGWEALHAYLEHHDKAMGAGDDDASRRREEAFALHFLTDLFAAGHIRTERRDLSAFDSQMQHDWENRYGLVVGQRYQTRRDDGRVATMSVYWRAYGDDCLLDDESVSTRVLAEWSVYHSLREVITGQSQLGWNRPIALPPVDDDCRNGILAGSSLNRDRNPDFREHFAATLAIGSMVPVSSADRSAAGLLKTRFGYEYYPPLWHGLFWTGQMEFESSRRMGLVPVGLGYHYASLFWAIGPSFRWSTQAKLFELGGQLSAGWSWMPYPPVEFRLRVCATPYIILGSSDAETTIQSDHYTVEAFFELVFLINR